MRRAMASVLGVLLLASACGSSDGGGGGGEKMAYTTVKSSVDELATKILPALAAALDGEFPRAEGGFTECGVGPGFQKYSVRTELHSAAGDDASAAEKIRSVLADAGLDAKVEDDQAVTAARGGTKVVVESSGGRPVAGRRIRILSIDTSCASYSDADADAISEIPAEVYGEPVTATS